MVEEFTTHDHFSSTHVFGSCRMGENAKSSVVNLYGCTHDCDNLYLADASVFPRKKGVESSVLDNSL